MSALRNVVVPILDNPESSTEAVLAVLRAIPGVRAVQPTGSRTICDPPPTDTDRDFIVVTHDPNTFYRTCGDENGVMPEDGSRVADPFDQLNGGFISVRRGINNMILTSSNAFFNRFFAATFVAKRLNLLDKADRIALFQAVLYGNPRAVDGIGNPIEGGAS